MCESNAEVSMQSKWTPFYLMCWMNQINNSLTPGTAVTKRSKVICLTEVYEHQMFAQIQFYATTCEYCFILIFIDLCILNRAVISSLSNMLAEKHLGQSHLAYNINI